MKGEIYISENFPRETTNSHSNLENSLNSVYISCVSSNSITVIDFLQLNFAEEQIKQMKPTGIDFRFTESTYVLRPFDHRPLDLDELRTLISMAAKFGYSVENARDMKTPYGVISSDLFAVWYAIENELCIFADNIDHLINLTGWERSPADLEALSPSSCRLVG